PEVNDVASEIVALARVEQCQGSFVGNGALLDLVELRDFLGVDRRDEMYPVGLVEGSWPVLWRAWPDIAELQCAGRHAFDEFVREHFERSTWRAQDAQSLIGQANVETGVRLGGPPIPRRDLRHTVAAGYGVGEPASGCEGIGDFQDEVAHARLAVA